MEESSVARVVVTEPHAGSGLEMPVDPMVQEMVLSQVPDEGRGREVLVVGSGAWAVAAAWQVVSIRDPRSPAGTRSIPS